MPNRLLTVKEFGERCASAWQSAVVQTDIAEFVLADQHRRLWGCPEWSPRFDGLSWADVGVIAV